MFVERNRKLKYIPGYIIVTLLAALPLFGHLSELPVQRWDESRLALAAIEMTFHKNLFVTTFLGQPDMAAMKPPLQIWCLIMADGNGRQVVAVMQRLISGYSIRTCKRKSLILS